jgi:6-phosphogluconate dehydrogenase
VQGLHLLQTASVTYNYDINISEVIRVWKGGCIIRSAMLNDLGKAYTKNNQLPNVLLDKDFYLHLRNHRNEMVGTIAIAMDNEIAVSCMSSCLGYFDMFSTGRLPSNLIQAQRDYFGAHTYERTDKEGSFHTNWN